MNSCVTSIVAVDSLSQPIKQPALLGQTTLNVHLEGVCGESSVHADAITAGLAEQRQYVQYLNIRSAFTLCSYLHGE